MNDVFDMLIDDKPNAYVRKEIIDAMLRGNLIATVEAAGVVAPEVPVAMDLGTYISAYWEYIHPHLPIFFKSGFVPQFAQEGVLLGMCALGALALNAFQHARNLTVCAKAVVRHVLAPFYRTDSSVGIMGIVSYPMYRVCCWRNYSNCIIEVILMRILEGD